MRRKRQKFKTIKIKGLRRRWITNTLTVVCVLGLICAVAVTAAFSAYYYKNLESDMRYRAQSTTDFFGDFLRKDDDYYQTCVTYVRTFENSNEIQLQFIDAEGKLAAASYAFDAGTRIPETKDIENALSTRNISSYFGKNAQNGIWVMAVSGPVIDSSGNLIGVLRYVTPVDKMISQIATVAGIALAVLAVSMICAALYSYKISKTRCEFKIISKI